MIILALHKACQKFLNFICSVKDGSEKREKGKILEKEDRSLIGF